MACLSYTGVDINVWIVGSFSCPCRAPHPPHPTLLPSTLPVSTCCQLLLDTRVLAPDIKLALRGVSLLGAVLFFAMVSPRSRSLRLGRSVDTVIQVTVV